MAARYGPFKHKYQPVADITQFSDSDQPIKIYCSLVFSKRDTIYDKDSFIHSQEHDFMAKG